MSLTRAEKETPKDGPSAGISMDDCFGQSAFTSTKSKEESVANDWWITLRGKECLPVGRIKKKY